MACPKFVPGVSPFIGLILLMVWPAILGIKTTEWSEKQGVISHINFWSVYDTNGKDSEFWVNLDTLVPD